MFAPPTVSDKWEEKKTATYIATVEIIFLCDKNFIFYSQKLIYNIKTLIDEIWTVLWLVICFLFALFNSEVLFWCKNSCVI